MSIERRHTNQRMSQVVSHAGLVYLAGQVASGAPGESVAAQTEDILARIDELLAEAGSDKATILTANVWLTDIGTFDEFNAVWDAWVPAGSAPVRACVEAKLAAPRYTVEVMVTAALKV
ncbi:MAG: endoribonuclease [Devosia sp.]|jgi:enamine deaminase RidA (YjgF/YER057c/UK114 family)|nr:endoribonuclease [Devosia sp.]